MLSVSEYVTANVTASHISARSKSHFCTEQIIAVLWSVQGRNEGAQGGHNFRAPIHYGGAESLRRAPKSPQNITNTSFSAVNLRPKEVRFEHGAPNLLLAPGAI